MSSMRSSDRIGCTSLISFCLFMDFGFSFLDGCCFFIARKTDVTNYSRHFAQKKKSAANDKRAQWNQRFECIFFSSKISLFGFSREVNRMRVLNVTYLPLSYIHFIQQI